MCVCARARVPLLCRCRCRCVCVHVCVPACVCAMRAYVCEFEGQCNLAALGECDERLDAGEQALPACEEFERDGQVLTPFGGTL